MSDALVIKQFDEIAGDLIHTPSVWLTRAEHLTEHHHYTNKCHLRGQVPHTASAPVTDISCHHIRSPRERSVSREQVAAHRQAASSGPLTRAAQDASGDIALCFPVVYTWGPAGQQPGRQLSWQKRSETETR